MPTQFNLPALDRRSLLRVGAAAAATAALAPRSARASQPTDVQDLQGAGCFKTKVGEAEVVIISDGTLRMPPVPTFAVNAAKEEAATQLRRHFLEPEASAPLHVNTMLVRIGGKTVLVDTGNGPDAKPGAGRVATHLRRLGVKPGGIDMVVITHLHGDHSGGLFDGELREMASSADIVLSSTERDFWLGTPDLSASSLNDEFKARMTANARQATDSAGKQLRAVKPDEELVSGLRLLPLPGHTPGHIGLKLTSGDANFVYFADTVHFGPLQFERPEWYVAFDADPEVAVRSRQELFAKLAEERTLVAGSHIAFPALGHLRKEVVGYAWVPTIWEW